ncbi:hypothetical protein BDV28DRAFT_129124 [Aspergillus coremiiformis]|uniref:Uncharacterized protein n=1 Tax=Aspergillus coremiiformis TaxID=138285 RepID=A0A5N6ZCF5_9EURO|nr:hypothetical protein BDV28DRAFT_129124 [Aspergillus coremiiformis]
MIFFCLFPIHGVLISFVVAISCLGLHRVRSNGPVQTIMSLGYHIQGLYTRRGRNGQ